MKAAVITLHTVCNYGTQLQAYATQEKLKEYFDDVVFIDYRRSDTYGMGLLKTFVKGNPLKIPVILPTLLWWKRVFGKFQKQYLNIDSNVYLNNEDFSRFKDCADVYFSGSDQVWNAGWNKGIIPPMYLSFVPDEKPKYAYASSFGRSKVSEQEVRDSKRYIDRYNFITVREESGVPLLKEQYNYQNVYRILDPTLSMTPEFWRKVAPARKIKEDYILIYNLQRSKEFDQYAEELQKRTGLKLYRFCTRFDQMIKNGKSLLIPDILEFVSLIDNASIVLTDSFHATAFSMNMNTEPICIYPSDYSCRLSEFLNLVEAGHRHANDFEDFDVLNRPVDFERVNQILNQERKKTDEFLTMVQQHVKKMAEERMS
ncbi:polysaccharide pyruvyl transferase family protein [uncultured Allofournierella sp.]|uniref:polysaccharide pyruvyl transferase family protein n=1 Tax=uncultured Allofournierella sp. TaxID=1940258 RepID=UPI0037501AD3